MFKNIVNRNISFGLVVGTRGFFNPNLAEKGRKLLISRLSEPDEEALTTNLDWDLYRHHRGLYDLEM